MAITGTSAVILLIGRLLFGGTLAFMGLNHFTNPEQMVPYAESKGVPRPKLAVYASGAFLVLGGLSIVTGIYAGVGAVLITLFFLVTTPMIHNFWAVPEEEQRDQMTQFLKNTAILGATLGFLGVSMVNWGLAVGIGII